MDAKLTQFSRSETENSLSFHLKVSQLKSQVKFKLRVGWTSLLKRAT